MNWTGFLDDYSIEYVTRSRNTRRGEISIQCPFCGDDDPSMHCGISLEKDAWGCLRDPSHRGLMPHRLVAALLGISNKQADTIVKRYSRTDPTQFIFNPLNLDDKPFTEVLPKATLVSPELQPPSEWSAIKAMGSTCRFWRYLQMRGFHAPAAVIEDYRLKCCLTGRWKDRLIFPLYHDERLIGWTGRALVNPLGAPRYLASGDAIKKTLFNYDGLTGGKLLFLCEGPFDAMKLDHYGKARLTHATCGFGTQLSIDQIYLIRQLTKRYDRVIVMFDFGAFAPASIAADWIWRGNVVNWTVPEGFKDPGELKPDDVHSLITAAWPT